MYKYREHIYFLQQRFKQDGGSPIPSSILEIQPPIHGNNLSRLYGNTAPQYINEMILQGNSQAKFAAGALPEGKKAGPGKHGDGTGKPWQYQQVRREKQTDKQTNKAKKKQEHNQVAHTFSLAIEHLRLEVVSICSEKRESERNTRVPRDSEDTQRESGALRVACPLPLVRARASFNRTSRRIQRILAI